MFTFETNKAASSVASKDDIKGVIALAKDIAAGKHSSDKRFPGNNAALFSEASLNEYARQCSIGAR
jgi:hypothetical protein